MYNLYFDIKNNTIIYFRIRNKILKACHVIDDMLQKGWYFGVPQIPLITAGIFILLIIVIMLGVQARLVILQGMWRYIFCFSFNTQDLFASLFKTNLLECTIWNHEPWNQEHAVEMVNKYMGFCYCLDLLNSLIRQI